MPPPPTDSGGGRGDGGHVAVDQAGTGHRPRVAEALVVAINIRQARVEAQPPDAVLDAHPPPGERPVVGDVLRRAVTAPRIVSSGFTPPPRVAYPLTHTCPGSPPP